MVIAINFSFEEGDLRPIEIVQKLINLSYVTHFLSLPPSTLPFFLPYF